MNASSNSEIDVVEVDAGGSDSDSYQDESPEYYQPVSAAGDDEEELSDENSQDEHSRSPYGLPNGYVRCMENGVSALDLSDEEGGETGDEELEEEERMREASASAIRRAFRDDESRRNAPLTPENAGRVINAMRGISFAGIAPDWVGHFPEDQWIDQLRRLRRPPPSTAAISK